MKRTISIILSLILAIGTCLSMAVSSFAADRKFEIPKTIKGVEAGTDDWNTSLSYNKSSKTLTCTCDETRNVSGFFEYLYALSSDSMSNRFLDWYDSSTVFAKEDNQNLFSVDPIRFGKIKEIDINQKSGKKTSPLGKFTFETKNNKVVGNAVYVLNTRGQLWARVKNSFSYDKNGLISKAVMTCRDPDLHYKVESTYSYDSQNRPVSCLCKQIDTETGKVEVTNRIDFSDYNNAGWPTEDKRVQLTEPEVGPNEVWVGVERAEEGPCDFNDKGQMLKDSTWNYSYDSQGRLTKLSQPASDSSDEISVTFSSFFTI